MVQKKIPCENQKEKKIDFFSPCEIDKEKNNVFELFFFL